MDQKLIQMIILMLIFTLLEIVGVKIGENKVILELLTTILMDQENVEFKHVQLILNYDIYYCIIILFLIYKVTYISFTYILLIKYYNYIF